MSGTEANIMIVGVGGQGVIMAAGIVAEVALVHGGLEVKQSETHGMSQRGGSVHSQIRIGERVLSPVISPGEVEYLLAFEIAECLRWAPVLADDGVAIVSTERIVPPIATAGKHSYPDDALARLSDGRIRLVAVDARELGEEAGSVKAAGVALLGVLSNHLPFSEDTWIKAISNKVATGWLPMNIAAFAAGRRAGTPRDVAIQG